MRTREGAQRLPTASQMQPYIKAKRVAVAGVCHNCREHHGFQAEPKATADSARCASEPTPYLRHSALTDMTALVESSTPLVG